MEAPGQLTSPKSGAEYSRLSLAFLNIKYNNYCKVMNQFATLHTIITLR